MKKIVPFNNILVAKLLSKKEEASPIILPDREVGRFIRLRILCVGELVTHIQEGDIVLANALFEVIDPREPTIGFINSKDVLAKEVNE